MSASDSDSLSLLAPRAAGALAGSSEANDVIFPPTYARRGAAPREPIEQRASDRVPAPRPVSLKLKCVAERGEGMDHWR